MRDLPGVFGLGNVLTGKGNIRDSRDNSQHISRQVLASYSNEQDQAGEARDQIREQARTLSEAAKASQPLSPDQLREIAKLVELRWKAAGYRGDYRAYVAR